MAETVETLAISLAALREQRASGVRSTRFENDEVQYRSDAEIAAAIADLENRIVRLGGQSPVRVTYFKSSKGI